MDKKEIKIDPTFFSMSNKKPKKSGGKKTEKAKKDMLVNVNGKSVKEMLLQKLKEYKKNKTRKEIPTHHNSNINSDFIEKIKKRKQKTENNINLNKDELFQNKPIYHQENISFNRNSVNHDKQLVHNPISINNNDEFMQNNNISQINNDEINIQPTNMFNQFKNQPLYSNLKNSIRPTFRELKNKNNKTQKVKSKLELQVERKLHVGINKTRKKVGVFIKNNILRRNTEDNKLKLKEKNMKNVKEELKKDNLIKYGTFAPNDLLREIYESSFLVCGVKNNNSDNIIHNFHSEDD